MHTCNLHLTVQHVHEYPGKLLTLLIRLFPFAGPYTTKRRGSTSADLLLLQEEVIGATTARPLACSKRQTKVMRGNTSVSKSTSITTDRPGRHICCMGYAWVRLRQPLRPYPSNSPAECKVYRMDSAHLGARGISRRRPRQTSHMHDGPSLNCTSWPILLQTLGSATASASAPSSPPPPRASNCVRSC